MGAKVSGGSSVQVLDRVGPKMAQRLHRLNVDTVEDLLFHLPLRYQDRTKITAIGSCRPGMEVVIVACIDHSGIAYGRRRALLVRVSDGTGALTIRLFHFSAAQQKQMQKGRWIQCFGEIRLGPSTLELIHPEYQVSERQPEPDINAGLTPIYPATEGVGQGLLRRLVDQVLRMTLSDIKDWLPQEIMPGMLAISLLDAIRFLHHPPVDVDLQALAEGRTQAQKRIAFEELLVHHLSLRRARLSRQRFRAPEFTGGVGVDKITEFINGLPFSLTNAQKRVMDEISKDISRPEPMLRLIQGDVGSGKTVVAAVAALRVALGGWQTALMAPTELLAEQHYRNLCAWFEPIGIQVAWLSGQSSAKQRQQALLQLTNGEASIVVGTHALFQSGVSFKRLGLVVIDEQHRFGVNQRLALQEKGRQSDHAPHQLNMTATPIPRTLAMTFYADLEISSIDELPPGRKPIETVAIKDDRRDEVIERVRQAMSSGRQAYWVCPFVEESEFVDVQAATKLAQTLADALSEYKVGLVHGRMKAQEKDKIMRGFRDGEIQLLVATTVIEVGVDVANASLIIIENSERLGLSQLHQLRGRVGRSDQSSVCVLMYRAPLGDHARIRLAALRETNDGFELSRRDLELRGPGEVLGTRQTGMQRMRVADLNRDHDLLADIQKSAKILLEKYPSHIDPLLHRWLGHEQIYAQV